jgi:hypothetical protein
MVWGKRRLAGIDYVPAMDLVEKLMMANAALYREFIMVSVKTSKFGTDDYYIGVPNKMFLVLFDGFDAVDEAALPKQIDTLHIADVAAFESRFQFAHNSVR